MLASLVAAERAFAEASVARGMRAAFLEYLADESILFRPGPVDGKAYFEERPETSGTLRWQPAFADVSDTGDLGYTTGPWTFSDSAGIPVAYGHYVSVWRRHADSTWRVAVDAGINHPEPWTPLDEEVASPRDTTRTKPLRKLYIEAARVALLKADRDMAVASAERGSVAAFRTVMADSVRIYRDGAFPQVGSQAMVDLLDRLGGTLTWVPVTARVSEAGDLGYTYGHTTLRAAAGDTTATSSTYLRIWKASPGVPWRLVLDLGVPLPPVE